MSGYLRVKFEVSSIILKSFIQRVGGGGEDYTRCFTPTTPPPPSPPTHTHTPQDKHLKIPTRLGLMTSLLFKLLMYV